MLALQFNNTVFSYSLQMFDLYKAIVNKPIRIPFFSSLVNAGFPSPAEDHIEQTLDITELLVTNPPATFYLRVSGDSMINAGIFEKDILVVDRSLTAQHGDIVVAQINEDFTVKRFYTRDLELILYPENPKYQPIVIKEGDEFTVFGVVTSVVRQLKCMR